MVCLRGVKMLDEYIIAANKFIGDNLNLLLELTKNKMIVVNKDIIDSIAILIKPKSFSLDKKINYIDHFVYNITFVVEDTEYILLPDIPYLLRMQEFSNPIINDYLLDMIDSFSNNDERNHIYLDINKDVFEKSFTIFTR